MPRAKSSAPDAPIAYTHLTPRHIAGLLKHQYSAADNSLVDSVFQHWWNFVVEFVPLSVAPNLITVSGLVVYSAMIAPLCYEGAALTGAGGALQWWMFACFSAGLFIYQTLDAIDGKQARRTGTSTPLGELFDHGCDAIACNHVCLSTVTAMGWTWAEHTYVIVAMFFCTHMAFFRSHWRAYFTHTMEFGKLDVTEGQLFLMGVHAYTAYLYHAGDGGARWAAALRPGQAVALGYDWSEPRMLVFAFICLTTTSIYALTAVELLQTQGAGKALPLLVPGFSILATTLGVMRLAGTETTGQHGFAFVSAMGLLLTMNNCKIVVAHMTAKEVCPETQFKLLLPELLPLVGLGLFYLSGSAQDAAQSLLAARVAAGATLLIFAHYFIGMINDICNGLPSNGAFLRGECFRIKHAKE